jgi:hypothetical protein
MGSEVKNRCRQNGIGMALRDACHQIVQIAYPA